MSDLGRVVVRRAYRAKVIQQKTNILLFNVFSALGWAIGSIFLEALLKIFGTDGWKGTIPLTTMAYFAAVAAIILGIRSLILKSRLNRLRP
jgi:hypothetical protein